MKKTVIDRRQTHMWSGGTQVENTATTTTPKARKPAKQKTQAESDAEKWWRDAVRFAEDAHNGETAYLSPKLTREEVWQKSDRWIYDRFDRLGKLVETGITTNQLAASVAKCSYIEHRNRTAYTYLPELWLRPGTLEYVRAVKRHGLLVVREQQIAFGRGFTDASGQHWCGFCSYRARLMNAGAALDYPGLQKLYSLAQLPDGSPVVGRENWLAFCQTASDVRIENAVQAAEAAVAVKQKA